MFVSVILNSACITQATQKSNHATTQPSPTHNVTPQALLDSEGYAATLSVEVAAAVAPESALLSLEDLPRHRTRQRACHKHTLGTSLDSDTDNSFGMTTPKQRKHDPRKNLTRKGLATATIDFVTIASNSMAQARRYARNPSSDAPTDPHHVSTSGVLVRLNLPQSCGGGTLRPRTKVSVSSASGRACTKRTRTTSLDSDSDTSSKKTTRKPRKHKSGKHLRLAFSYPDADAMFRLVESELGLGEQLAFYSPSGWCRPPPEHPDLAAWLLAHPLDAEESQQERRVREDSRRAAEFRLALESTAPTEICCVCSCFVCKSVCNTYPLESLPGLELLRTADYCCTASRGAKRCTRHRCSQRTRVILILSLLYWHFTSNKPFRLKCPLNVCWPYIPL